MLASVEHGECILLLVVVVFLVRGRTRSAQVSLAALVIGLILVETMRHTVGARRPGNAETFLAPEEMTRSFPARSVLLFTLAGVLLIFAAWGALSSTWMRLMVTVVMVVVVLGVALSQLMLQLHFVTDVVGGLFGGLTLALLASRFFEERRDAGSTRPGSTSG